MNLEEKQLASLVGGIKNYKMQRDFQLRFLKQRGLKPEHKVLDIGCGVLRGGVRLIDYLDTNNYYGTEARDFVYNIANKVIEKKRLQDKRPRLFFTEDLSPIRTKFDYMWAFMVFIHLTDDRLINILAQVKSRLLDGGKLYANVNVGTSREKAWQGFPVMWRPFKHYADICKSYGLVCEDIGSLKFNGHDNGLSIKQQAQQRMVKITHENINS